MTSRRKLAHQSRLREVAADDRVLGGGPKCRCTHGFRAHEYEGLPFSSPNVCTEPGCDCRKYEPASDARGMEAA